MPYTVLSSGSLQSLSREVNEYMEAGWTAEGGIAVCAESFYQAMYKPIPKSSEVESTSNVREVLIEDIQDSQFEINKVKILYNAGWSIDCESPLEISHVDSSRATGRAAQIIIDVLIDDEKSKIRSGKCDKG